MEIQMPLPSTVDVPREEPHKAAGTRRSGLKYKKYSQEHLDAALRAVQQGEMSLRKAAIHFQIPKTTLAEKLGSSCPNLVPLVTRRHTRKGYEAIGTRFTWSEVEMDQAIAAVQAGTPVSDAARQFGVPPSILNSRARGRQARGLMAAEYARLTLRQENLMVEWATAACALGVPPTKDEIYDLANRALRVSGSEKTLGKQWVGHWLRRHPQIQALDWVSKSNSPRPSTDPISFTRLEFSPTEAAGQETQSEDVHEVVHETLMGEDMPTVHPG